MSANEKADLQISSLKGGNVPKAEANPGFLNVRFGSDSVQVTFGDNLANLILIHLIS